MNSLATNLKALLECHIYLVLLTILSSTGSNLLSELLVPVTSIYIGNNRGKPYFFVCQQFSR
jgi:hypothetical protein